MKDYNTTKQNKTKIAIIECKHCIRLTDLGNSQFFFVAIV